MKSVLHPMICGRCYKSGIYWVLGGFNCHTRCPHCGGYNCQLPENDNIYRQYVKDIHDQREEILRAFIAKYELEPDEAIQVEQRMEDGSIKWSVRRMTDEEKRRSV